MSKKYQLKSFTILLPIETLEVVLEIRGVVNSDSVTGPTLQLSLGEDEDELPVLVILHTSHSHLLLPLVLPESGHGDGVVLDGEVRGVESDVRGRLVAENLQYIFIE